MKNRGNIMNILVNDIKTTRILSNDLKKQNELQDMSEWLDEQWAKDTNKAWQTEGYIIYMTFLEGCIEISMSLTDDTPYDQSLWGVLFSDQVTNAELEALYNLSN